jgi:predicted NAD-dependent protein-ADP-ribosyltransferase YbiA (DUF1768 family)
MSAEEEIEKGMAGGQEEAEGQEEQEEELQDENEQNEDGGGDEQDEEEEEEEAGGNEESDKGEGTAEGQGLLGAIAGVLGRPQKPAEPAKTELKPVKEKAKKKKSLPKIKDSASFFRARRKYPKNFIFSETGDLVKINLEGQQETTLTLPYYAPTTADEKEQAEATRKEQLLLIEKEYDDALELLKSALSTWRETRAASDVLYLQVKLKELDARRSLLQHGAKWLINAADLETKQVLVEKQRDHRKMPYVISLLRVRANRFNELVKVVDGPPELAKEEEDEEISLSGEGEAAEETIFGFFGPDDPELGFLSPDTKITFVFNNTEYNSPSQAFVVERLKQLGREEAFLKTILKMGDPRRVRLFGKSASVQGELKDPLGLWTQILKSLIAQHPETAELLRITENYTLVYADPTEKVWGIGLPINSPDLENKEAWVGQNLLGKAWMNVRKLLPPEGAQQRGGGMVAASDIHQRAMTKERVAAKKARILRHMYKYKPTN